MSKVLEIKNLNVRFVIGNIHINAVNNVDFSLYEGETVCIIGESGSGKSVLGLSILRLLPENTEITGKILFEGKDILSMNDKEIRKIRGRLISWIPQSPSKSLNPVLTVGYQVAEPMILHLKLDKKTAYGRVVKLFEYFGILPAKDRIKEYPHQFSGGMKQRVLVAMGTSTNPKIIIADEPTKGLDVVKKLKIIRLFKKIKKDNPKLSLLLITHDIQLAKKLADRVAVMYCGQILEITKAEDFFKEPLHPYSKALLESLPTNGLKPIPGMSPSMLNPPKGCKFHPRCKYFSKICLNEPKFYEYNGNFVRCFLYDSGKKPN